ncbi:MAG: trehalose-phosphatase [Candidatus Dormibacteraceae bacterium]
MAETSTPLGLDPTNTTIFLDNDGVLSPIVDDPTKARPLGGTSSRLQALVKKGYRVVIVTGRPPQFIEQQFSTPEQPFADLGVEVQGLYGLQSLRNGQVENDSRLEENASAVRKAYSNMINQLTTAEAPMITTETPDGTGIYVEPKYFDETGGRLYGFAVHLRRASEEQRTEWEPKVKEIVEAIARESGVLPTGHELHVKPGRMVYEMAPKYGVDKGTVVTQNSSGETVVAVGDDLGDVPGFKATKEWANANPTDRQAVVVVATSDETPDRVREEADWLVPGPEGVATFLEGLAEETPGLRINPDMDQRGPKYAIGGLPTLIEKGRHRDEVPQSHDTEPGH